MVEPEDTSSSSSLFRSTESPSITEMMAMFILLRCTRKIYIIHLFFAFGASSILGVSRLGHAPYKLTSREWMKSFIFEYPKKKGQIPKLVFPQPSAAETVGGRDSWAAKTTSTRSRSAKEWDAAGFAAKKEKVSASFQPMSLARFKTLSAAPLPRDSAAVDWEKSRSARAYTNMAQRSTSFRLSMTRVSSQPRLSHLFGIRSSSAYLPFVFFFQLLLNSKNNRPTGSSADSFLRWSTSPFLARVRLMRGCLSVCHLSHSDE